MSKCKHPPEKVQTHACYDDCPQVQWCQACGALRAWLDFSDSGEWELPESDEQETGS